MPEAFADLRIAEHQGIADHLVERHVAIGQQGMAGGYRHHKWVEPDRLGHQSFSNRIGLSKTNIEQVVVEPSDLFGEGDLREADLDLRLLLSALRE
ncbi:hypothetical protein D3C76_1146390 [compost metagenome]